MIEGGVVSFVRADHIRRPVFATNSAGVKTWTATYTPFGGVHVSTGAPSSARFPGQWFQSESGLHQNWMRDYDPTTGRYLQPDPLGLVDGASVYGYVGQSPMRNVDPSGQCIGPTIVICAEAAFAGIVLLSLYLACPDDLNLDFGWLFPATPGPGHNGGPPLDDPDPNPGSGAGPGPNPGGTAAAAAAVAAAAAANEYDGNKTPQDNARQNKSFKDAVNAIERQLGRKLSKREVRRLHEDITGEGYGYHQIVSEGLSLFE